MIKTVNVDGGELKLSANAATPFRYKQLFGSDLLKLFQQGSQENGEAILGDVVPQLAFIMNRQAEGVNMNSISIDEFYTWLEGFEPMSLLVAGQEIIETYLASAATSVESKKK